MLSALNEYETGSWSLIMGSGTFSDINKEQTTLSGLSLGENIVMWRVTNNVCPSVDDYVTIKVNDLINPHLNYSQWRSA